MMIRVTALCLPLLLAASCVSPPERACNRERFSWPNFLIEPSQDVDSAEGIQIDFSVGSDLAPGLEVTLLIAEGDEDRAVVGSGVSAEDGSIAFTGISVPLGRMVFFLEVSDDCGTHRSGKRTFVWDGLGFPSCELALGSGPQVDPEGSIPVLKPEHDADPNTPGFQASVEIVAGRPDMEVRLFVVDRETGDEQNFSLEVGEDSRVVQQVTLGQGEQAMRAVCIWELEDLRPSTPTYEFFVE